MSASPDESADDAPTRGRTPAAEHPGADARGPGRRIVVAPDGFKGSIAAVDAASALAEGWSSVRPEDAFVLRPMADGGEGTLAAFEAAIAGAKRMPVAVVGPDDEPVDASWLLLPPGPDSPGGTGVVELASTSGIELLAERRVPLTAHTVGFGQAIRAALASGVSRLVLGIGSSASTDGGAGLLVALGARLTDAGHAPIGPGAGGLGDLEHLELAGLVPLPPGGAIVLTDVTNPLLGPEGAAVVFGPQKGLDSAGIALAERGLARLAAEAQAGSARIDPQTPGAGAAGGTGFALLLWGARLVPGAAEVAAVVGLDEAFIGASLVVTGEGSFDGQSAAGKAPAHVARRAAETGVPVALVAGRIAADAATSAFTASVSLTELAGSSAAALAEPARWLRAAGAELARRA